MDSVGQMDVIWRNDYMAFVLISAFRLCIYAVIFFGEVGKNAGDANLCSAGATQGTFMLPFSHHVW